MGDLMSANADPTSCLMFAQSARDVGQLRRLPQPILEGSMETHCTAAATKKRRGAVRKPAQGLLLIIVLVTIVMMTLAAFTFTSLMQVEMQSARVLSRRVQSKYLADSGVDYTRLFLAAADQDIQAKGGLWDNADAFQGVPAAVDVNNLALLGRFSVVAPSLNDDGIPEGFRFGLVNESSKININALPFYDNWQPGSARQILLALPSMTEEIADAILDWVDTDDDEREFGTEGSHYRGLNPPYDVKNGPMDSLDELLLVRDVTPELLFGLDVNRNGVLDDIETVGTNASSLDADMHLGWANYVTLFSKESNLNGEGLVRVNINGTDLDLLQDDLKASFNDQWTNYILQYRINGPSAAVPNPEEDTIVLADEVPLELTGNETGSFTFASVVDLVETYVEVTNADGDPVFLRSPINIETLGVAMTLAMKNLTIYEGDSIPGRINIMQAPRRTMEGIPGMDSELIDRIIEVREFELDDPGFLDLNRNYETWLLTEFLVDVSTMRSLMPFICVGGDVYQAEVIGYFGDGVGTSRAEAIIDTTVDVPKLIFWRDKTHLQGTFSVDVLGGDFGSGSRF